MLSRAVLLLAMASAALARTDLVGCTSTVNGPLLTWYVPGTGELCEFLDCGGGRAPPKTTVPGCALYAGTATYSPNYLPGYGPNGQAPAASTPAPAPVASSAAVVPPKVSGSAALVSSGGAAAPSGSGVVPAASTITPLTTLTSTRPVNGTSVRTPSASSVLTQSVNAGNLVNAPVVGGLLLGAAALVL